MICMYPQLFNLVYIFIPVCSNHLSENETQKVDVGRKITPWNHSDSLNLAVKPCLQVYQALIDGGSERSRA